MTRTILIAGGGTGGHVFSGVAIARALVDLADVRPVFVGTKRGIESRVVPEQGFELELLEVEPMKGGGPSRAIRGALVAAKAMRHAAGLANRLRPAAVLSVGGYAAGPASLACVGKRIPLAVLEPNSILGLANRLLAPFAGRAYVAFPETAKKFGEGKSRLLGVPLRHGFAPRTYLADPRRRRVLVLGGSLGAEALNERVPSAIARAARAVGPIEVVHQTGKDREEATRAAYRKAGVDAVVVTAFLDDVAGHMASADIVLARAGAVTVAEISAVGRAAVLVPFPHAADDHQTKNAEALARAGGAVCLPQSIADEARIGGELTRLFQDTVTLERMAQASQAHGRPEAAQDIARDLLALAGVPLAPKHKTNGHGAPGGILGDLRTFAKEVS